MPEWRGVYRPIAPVKTATPGSLAEFLTERYCLFAWNRGRMYCADIHHLPWPLQAAAAEIELDTMAQPLGLDLPPEPDVMHFSRALKVLIWPPERIL